MSLALRARAELELRRRRGHLRLLPPPFGDWLTQVSPRSAGWHWEWPHLAYIRQHLEALTEGAIDKLMVFCPPRSGKSEQDTIRYPVWRLECDPTLRVIIGAYNQPLAERFSRRARRIAAERMALSDDRNTAGDWETAAGGGMRAAGVGAGVTGHGADLIVIDDPVKSREEANSEAYRERVWEWYTEDLYTRREPGAAMLLTMTRWHEDDLAGRILASEDAPNWTVVSLPAEAEENDPLGRELGAPLCPARYDKAALEGIKKVLGSWAYAALYQQRPMPAGGGLIQRDWFVIVDEAPVQAQRVRYWDKAATEGGGAYSAGVLMAKTADDLYYVENVVRGQWSSGGRNTVMEGVADIDRVHYGNRVRVWVEQEPGSGGKESAEASIRKLAGVPVRADKVTGDKDVRLEPFAAQCEAGNVRLVRGPWNGAYIEELSAVPMGKYRDQADATAGAFNKLAGQRNFRIGFA